MLMDVHEEWCEERSLEAARALRHKVCTCVRMWVGVSALGAHFKTDV